MFKPMSLLIGTLFTWGTAYGTIIALGAVTFESDNGITSIQVENLTGGMGASDFPVATPLTFEDDALFLVPVTGSPIITPLFPEGTGFGPGTFDYPLGNEQYLEIGFAGAVSPDTFELVGGSVVSVNPSFEVLILPSSGTFVQPGDSAVITTSTIPEPSSLGSTALFLLAFFVTRANGSRRVFGARATVCFGTKRGLDDGCLGKRRWGL
jgi:hypothetical protein